MLAHHRREEFVDSLFLAQARIQDFYQGRAPRDWWPYLGWGWAIFDTRKHRFATFQDVYCHIMFNTFNGVEQPYKGHQCPFFLPFRRRDPRLRRGSLRPRGGRRTQRPPPPGSVPVALHGSSIIWPFSCFNVNVMPIFIYFSLSIQASLPIYGRAPASPAGLPEMRESPPHTRLALLGSPVRGPGDTGNRTRELPISRTDTHPTELTSQPCLM